MNESHFVERIAFSRKLENLLIEVGFEVLCVCEGHYLVGFYA
jgi:hypothetical protein